MRREAGVKRQATCRSQHRRCRPCEPRAIPTATQRACTPRDHRSPRLRIGQQRGQQQRVVARQRRRGLAEQPQRRCADPLRLAAKPGEVQIRLEYLVLRPPRLQRAGGTDLTQLVEPPPPPRRRQIGRQEAGDLHRQRARPARSLSCDPVAHRSHNRQPVNTAVCRKAMIFRRDDRLADHRRHRVKPRPRQPPRREIDARAVDQYAVAVVQPRFRRPPGTADLCVARQWRRQRRIIDRRETQDHQDCNGEGPKAFVEFDASHSERVLFARRRGGAEARRRRKKEFGALRAATRRRRQYISCPGRRWGCEIGKRSAFFFFSAPPRLRADKILLAAARLRSTHRASRTNHHPLTAAPPPPAHWALPHGSRANTSPRFASAAG